MEAANGIERTVGKVLLAGLAIGCILVLRPFFAALCFAVILVVATWPAFERLERLLGGRQTLAALLMVTLCTLVFVLPPALVASSVEYNHANVARLLRDLLSQYSAPPAWLADVDLIGSALYDRWQTLAAGGPEATERIQAFLAWSREQLVSTGLSLGNAVLQLILAMFTAFFLFRSGKIASDQLHTGTRRIAGDQAPRLLRVAYATIVGVVYGVLGTAVAQAVMIMIGLMITGIPGAPLLGLLLFVLALIPFGPALIWVPAAVWLFLNGDVGWSIAITVWSLAAGVFTDNVLRPYLISRGSDLPIILVLFGVVGGAVVFGVLGLFLGPTLLAVGYELIREWVAVEEPESRLKVAR